MSQSTAYIVVGIALLALLAVGVVQVRNAIRRAAKEPEA
jgi:hypothetical protein